MGAQGPDYQTTLTGKAIRPKHHQQKAAASATILFNPISGKSEDKKPVSTHFVALVRIATFYVDTETIKRVGWP